MQTSPKARAKAHVVPNSPCSQALSLPMIEHDLYTCIIMHGATVMQRAWTGPGPVAGGPARLPNHGHAPTWEQDACLPAKAGHLQGRQYPQPLCLIDPAQLSACTPAVRRTWGNAASRSPNTPTPSKPGSQSPDPPRTLQVHKRRKRPDMPSTRQPLNTCRSTRKHRKCRCTGSHRS